MIRSDFNFQKSHIIVIFDITILDYLYSKQYKNISQCNDNFRANQRYGNDNILLNVFLFRGDCRISFEQKFSFEPARFSICRLR